MKLKSLMIACLSTGMALTMSAETADSDDVSAPSLSEVSAAPDLWRAVDPENLVVMQTSKGRILIELSPEFAPRHVTQFKAYVRAGLYDNTPFHRVIKGFMAQGGDIEDVHGSDKMLPPLEAEFTIRRNPAELAIDTGEKASEALDGYFKGMPVGTQPAWLGEMSKDGLVESWIPHCPGVLSSARTGDPNSSNAQFFLISESGRHLDRDYTAKGRAIEGLDVIQAIKLGPEPNGFPIANPDVLITAKMAADIAAAERPKAYVQRTDAPEWRAKLTAASATKTSVCDLPPVPAAIFD